MINLEEVPFHQHSDIGTPQVDPMGLRWQLEGSIKFNNESSKTFEFVDGASDMYMLVFSLYGGATNTGLFMTINGIGSGYTYACTNALGSGYNYNTAQPNIKVSDNSGSNQLVAMGQMIMNGKTRGGVITLVGSVISQPNSFTLHTATVASSSDIRSITLDGGSTYTGQVDIYKYNLK